VVEFNARIHLKLTHMNSSITIKDERAITPTHGCMTFTITLLRMLAAWRTTTALVPAVAGMVELLSRMRIDILLVEGGLSVAGHVVAVVAVTLFVVVDLGGDARAAAF
jgi:hypothetical protein